MYTNFHENHTAAKIAAGEVALCMSVRLTQSVEIALMARAAGFDALYVDLEHGSLSPAQAGQVCSAALASGITPFVRVPSLDPHLAVSLLGNGALGLIVPHVSSATDLVPILDACRFPPSGNRSLGGAGVHFGFRAGDRISMAKLLGENTTIIVMLEDAAGVEQAEAIAALDGVSGIMIGSNDFLAELGDPGNYHNAALLAAFDTAAAACRQHGKFLGVAGIKQDKALIAALVEKGARFITGGSDSALLASSLKSQVDALRVLTQTQ